MKEIRLQYEKEDEGEEGRGREFRGGGEGYFATVLALG
jgi:hypothetical protein